MEKFLFAGNLLVCDTNLPAGCSFLWTGTLTSSNNKVEVVSFRTDKTSEFKPMLEKDLAELKTLAQTNNVKAQIAFIEQLLLQMSNSALIKTPSQSLIDCAGKCTKQKLTANDVVYLSGVSAVIK